MQILLVTTRGTGRWVIPKGNQPVGMLPHAAAAMEAEEEAGVTGIVCPTPLGSYRYRKRQSNGTSQMVEVDVFPLAVTREFASWKEQGERERRWFSQAGAAAAVAEPGLRDLILAFTAPECQDAVRPTGVPQPVAQKSAAMRLGAWVRRLLR